MRRIAAFLALTLLPQLASANCQSVSGDFRKCFDSTNSTPDIVFRHLAHRVFVASVDYLEDLSQIDDEPDHAGWNAVKSGLTPQMSSPDVVRYFAQKYIEMIGEVDDAQKQNLCANGVPRYKGAENAVIWNQLDEIGQNVFQKHFLLARSDLQASGLYDLDKALSEFSGTFTMIYMDHSLDQKQTSNQLTT